MDVVIMDKLEDILSAIEYNGGGILELKNKGAVKSVQRGRAEISELKFQTSKNIPISSVDINKAFLILDGERPDSYASSTEITLTTSSIFVKNDESSSSKSISFRWQVVEFY